MRSEAIGRIYDIQRFSVHDGPGIRTEVFLKGCPLKCLWCHSPESQSYEKQIGWFETRCIGAKACGKCLQVCPTGALKKGRTINSAVQKAEIELIERDPVNCRNCGKCVEACPAMAFCFLGRDVTVEEVMQIVDKDRAFYRKSGGGVTVSGGEPLVQYDFAAALLEACKGKGLNTCLDTTGFARWEICAKVLPFVDLVLYDLKHMDSNKSIELTGVPNELILENARKMAAEGMALQIRIPIIPGMNDSEENIRAVSRFCVELGPAVTIVQILPYHRLGTAKYERLQIKYQLESLAPPSNEHMKAIKRLIESHGLTARIH